MDRKFMDRRLNGYNSFNRNNFGRGYAREFPNEEDFMARKLGRYGSNHDRFSRDGRDNYRDNFRGNIRGMRDNLPRENVHESQATRDDSDQNGYTEQFHERQVNYHKNVHTKQSDDDLCEDRDDIRRGRDNIRDIGHGFQGDFRR